MPLALGMDNRAGWVTTGASKPVAMARAADALRDKQTTIRDQVTLDQMAAISGVTLAAPDGMHDDRALAHVIALAGLAQPKPGGTARVF